MINIMFAGVGGQGTILASKLVGSAAIKKGYCVRTTETIGMAQRGGSVVSHIRIGEEIHSPLIPVGCADVIIAFEPAEAVRNFNFLKKGGTVIVCENPIAPITDPNYDGISMLSFLKENVTNLVLFNSAVLENAKTLNIAMLGLLMNENILPFSLDDLKEVIKERLPQKFLEINMKALEIVL